MVVQQMMVGGEVFIVCDCGAVLSREKVMKKVKSSKKCNNFEGFCPVCEGMLCFGEYVDAIRGSNGFKVNVRVCIPKEFLKKKFRVVKK